MNTERFWPRSPDLTPAEESKYYTDLFWRANGQGIASATFLNNLEKALADKQAKFDHDPITISGQYHQGEPADLLKHLNELAARYPELLNVEIREIPFPGQPVKPELLLPEGADGED